MAIVRENQLTIEEFVRLYDEEGPFEFVNGERIPLMPQVAGHSYVEHYLYDAIRDLLKTQPTGKVMLETPFVLVDARSWVLGSRVPDLMFYRAERLENYKSSTSDWADKPFILVPDLAVEIVSAHDRYSDIDDKVKQYLEDGVELVWVIDPKRRIVAVYHKGQQSWLSVSDTLTGGEVIPGFEIKVADLFPAPAEQGEN